MRVKIKQVAAKERWGKDEFFGILDFAKTTARKSPTLCQNLLILLVEAGEAVCDKRLAGTVVLNAGNLLETLGVAEGALAYQLRAAKVFQECDAPALRALALVNAGNALVQHFGEYSQALDCYEEALPHFRKAMESPHLARVLVGMGHALKGLNRFEEAIERFEDACRLDPGMQSLDIYIGECLRALGRSDEAVARHSSLAKEATSQAPVALQALANDYLTAGRWEDALQAYKKAFQKAEADGTVNEKAQALYGFSNCYQETKRHAEAEQCLREAYHLAMSVKDSRIAAFCLDALAHILLARDDRPAARDAARRAIDLAQKTGDRNLEVRLWGNLGIALVSSDPDDLRQAIKSYEHGLALARTVGNAEEEARIAALLQHTKQGASWLSTFVDHPAIVKEAPAEEDRKRTIEAAIVAAEKGGDAQSLRQALSFAGAYFELEQLEWKKAADYYARAIDLYEDFLANVYSLQDQRAAGGLRVEDYAGIIHCCLQTGELERAW